jgi:hypothetical protein
MAEIRSIGLVSIKIGDIENDGGMGQTLAALGVTYQDTAELVQDTPEITNIFSEENDDPEEVIESKSPTRVKWSIMNFDPDELAKVLGGTSGANGWEAPVAKDPIEQSIEILTKTDVLIQIPRAKITAKLNMQFRKKGVTLVDIEAVVLVPTKANTPPMIIGTYEPGT